MKNYSVTLIGLGNIGFKYDLNTRENSKIKSHAKAINLHKRFNLLCGIDKNHQNRSHFEKLYKVKTYSKIEKSFRLHNPDIIVIAVATKNHLSVIREVLIHCTPKCILIEKPMGNNLHEAKKIISICSKKKIKLAVNYPRRSDRSFFDIKKKFIKKNNLPIIGHVFYTKDIYHNGCHYLNFLEFLFGQPRKIKCIDQISGRSNKGSKIIVSFDFENAKILFSPSIDKNKVLNTLDLIIDNKKIHFDYNGRIFVSFLDRNDISYEINTKQDVYQFNVYEELYKYLNNKRALICTGLEALNTMKNLEKIRNEI